MTLGEQVTTSVPILFCALAPPEAFPQIANIKANPVASIFSLHFIIKTRSSDGMAQAGYLSENSRDLKVNHIHGLPRGEPRGILYQLLITQKA